jgi:hypothetical protein
MREFFLELSENVTAKRIMDEASIVLLLFISVTNLAYRIRARQGSLAASPSQPEAP